MRPDGGTRVALSRAGLAFESVVPVPPDSGPMPFLLTLTICMVAAAILGFALLLFKRRPPPSG